MPNTRGGCTYKRNKKGAGKYKRNEELVLASKFKDCYYGTIVKNHGANFDVACSNGQTVTALIRGKFKNKVFVRPGDTVLVDSSELNMHIIINKYTPDEVRQLKALGELKNLNKNNNDSIQFEEIFNDNDDMEKRFIEIDKFKRENEDIKQKDDSDSNNKNIDKSKNNNDNQDNKNVLSNKKQNKKTKEKKETKSDVEEKINEEKQIDVSDEKANDVPHEQDKPNKKTKKNKKTVKFSSVKSQENDLPIPQEINENEERDVSENSKEKTSSSDDSEKDSSEPSTKKSTDKPSKQNSNMIQKIKEKHQFKSGFRQSEIVRDQLRKSGRGKKNKF